MPALQRTIRLQQALKASQIQIRHFTYPTKVPYKNPFDLPAQPLANDSTAVSQTSAKDGSATAERDIGLPSKHQPDYNVHTDYRTSQVIPTLPPYEA
jgi:hypothetical protein